MKPTIERLHDTLLETKDGVKACEAISKLAEHATKGEAEAKRVLAEYTVKGKIKHVRDFACSLIAEIADEDDRELASVFERGLSDETNRYWSILGFINTLGRDAYFELAKIASDLSVPLEDRGHAVKCLATYSKQPFDRQLPSDPGEWQADDLRTDEITAWSDAGFPDGKGHATPTRDPALDKPTSKLERQARRLDMRLAKKRDECQDSASPTNWLAVADDDDLKLVSERWKLPSVYLEFLTKFSPIKVNLGSKRFWNGGLQLYGAGELVEAQDGYALNPVSKKPIRDWPKAYLVIANHGGDPFVLDLSTSDGNDAIVLTAEHGTGAWDFDQVADSFLEFLKSLSR